MEKNVEKNVEKNMENKKKPHVWKFLRGIYLVESGGVGEHLILHPLPVSMLDASKAFDRVNFWSLFDKLITRSDPLFIASGWVMPIPHPLVFIMVLSKVEFYHQFLSMFIWII